MAKACVRCGTDSVETAKFCLECGTAFAESVPTTPNSSSLPRTAGPVVERRVCSILFADLVGFTTLSESRDPEIVRELLSEYFRVARTIVTRYGGVVEKFIGDAVMAVWGTPVAHEGDTERCVRAALELVASVTALGVEVGAPQLALRVGVVTGSVAATIGAIGEGMVAGDAVNTAARVQSSAPPRCVWVDETTRRRALPAIDFSDVGEHELKGKNGTRRLWRANRVVADVGGKQRVDGLEAPLIGRDVELRTIKSAFHAAVELGAPRLVTVSGEAGAGKSRLGWEFEKYVDGLADPVLWHRGRCLSYGQGTVFWALAEMVRQRLGLAEDDAPDVARARLTEGLAALACTVEDRAYISARLGRLLGVVDGDADGRLMSRDELFAGWRMFFEHLASTRPVVLVVEDAQHADPALLEFFDHLITWAGLAPIYVLVLSRSDAGAPGPFGRNMQDRVEVEVGRLEAREMGALVAALLPGIEAGSASAVARHANGNPLFCVEIVRSLIEGGVVAWAAGRYELTGNLGALAVPDNLQALFAARLDSLTQPARALVGDAAVLGQTFSAEAVAAVSGRNFPLVERELAELVSRSVFEVSTDPLSPQHGSFKFGQHMLRQVALETLSRRDRKSRHLAVAAHLREAFANDGEEVIGVVAQHYLDALSAVPEDPDAATVREQAATALVRAARVADRSGASARAGQLFTDAAALMLRGGEDRTLEAAAAWEQAAKAFVRAGLYAQAEAEAQRASDVYQAKDHTRAAARSLAHVGRNAGLQGHSQQAHAALSVAVEVLSPDPDEDTVFALGELAALEIFDGMPSWRDRIETAVRLGLQLGVPPEYQARLYIYLGIGVSKAGLKTEGMAAFDRAAELAERSGDSYTLALCLTNHARLVPPALALDLDRRACELARRMGAEALLLGCVNNLGATLIFLGDWDEAQAALLAVVSVDGPENVDAPRSTLALLAALRGDHALARTHSQLPRLRASEDPQDRVNVLVADAFLAASSGDDGEALEITGRILEHVEALGLTADLVYWTWSLASRLALRMGDLDRVRELVAMLDAHPLEDLPALLVAEGALARARLHAIESDEGAREAMARAVEDFRAAGSPFHLAHALLDLAEHLRRLGKTEGSLVLIDEARTIALRLGARPLLERVSGSAA